MAGIQNKVVYGEGVKITPTSSNSLLNLQQNVTDVASINHTGDPNGVISANPGSFCHDPVSGIVYRKSFGTSNIGWLVLGTDITLTGNSGGAISAVSNNFNLLMGNSTIKFVGTAGTQTLDFGPVSGNLGLGDNLSSLGAGLQNTSYGVGALHNITNVNGNSFFGYQAGFNIVGGTGNSGFGNSVMGSNVSGVDNSSFGNGSSSNNTGTQNSVLGSGALQGGGGGGGGNASFNVVSGYRSGYDLTTATNNCYYGWSSGLSVRTGSFNIGVGSSAGSLNTLADSSDIYIGHLGVAGESNTTRIGTQGSGAGQQNRYFAAGVTGVTVAGSAPIAVDTNGQFSSLGFGTANQVLTSNGAGTSPSFKVLPSQASNAGVYLNSTISNATGNGTFVTPVIFDTENFDVGSNYNPATGLFTIPTTGRYLVCVGITFTGLLVDHTSAEVRIVANGATVTRNQFNPFASSVGGQYTYYQSLVVAGTAGQTINIVAAVSGGTQVVGFLGASFGQYCVASFTFLG